MSTPESIESCIQKLAAVMLERGQTFSCAESCSGGLLSKHCTDLAGSSSWFECGCVTYSNAAKQWMIGVPAELIEQHGAVSEAVAEAMLSGLLARSQTDWGVAITGIAGPGGGSALKPVGTVCFAYGQRARTARVYRAHFDGDRNSVRHAAVIDVMSRLLAEIEKN